MFPEAEQMLADQLEDLMDHMVALKQQLTPSLSSDTHDVWSPRARHHVQGTALKSLTSSTWVSKRNAQTKYIDNLGYRHQGWSCMPIDPTFSMEQLPVV